MTTTKGDEPTAQSSAETRRVYGADLPRDHPDYNPFDHGKLPKREHEDDCAADALKRRQDRWRGHRYDVALLNDPQVGWQYDLAANLRRRDARRDPVKAAPTLMFTGADAVNVDATDAELCALVPLSDNEIASLKQRAEAVRRATVKRIDDEARRIVNQHNTSVERPCALSLSDLLAQPDEDATYRIGDVWPTGGRILLAAQFKAGKSTMVGNVIRTLVDGGKFLDKFDTAPVQRVALIDTELDPRTLRRWLRDQRIVNTDAVTVLPLRGAVSSFDILSAATRSEWAAQLADADVVILDCLRPILDAQGLSEDKDAGRVLVAFDELLAEIGADEGMVVTHMGHQNERARGDSRLLDWNDAMWKIVRDGDETDDDGTRPRYFSALGRDVSLPEGRLSFDTASRRLSYADGNRRESVTNEAVEKLLALIHESPGTLSKNAAEERLRGDGISQNTARAAIKSALASNAARVETGSRGAHFLHPGADTFTIAQEVE
ncbi:AAA family ATPase [Gordonia sp. NPDC003422]